MGDFPHLQTWLNGGAAAVLTDAIAKPERWGSRVSPTSSFIASSYTPIETGSFDIAIRAGGRRSPHRWPSTRPRPG